MASLFQTLGSFAAPTVANTPASLTDPRIASESRSTGRALVLGGAGGDPGVRECISRRRHSPRSADAAGRWWTWRHLRITIEFVVEGNAHNEPCSSLQFTFTRVRLCMRR